jgi:hypothetical protein
MSLKTSTHKCPLDPRHCAASATTYGRAEENCAIEQDSEHIVTTQLKSGSFSMAYTKAFTKSRLHIAIQIIKS